jgi:hypothetical protein
MTVQRLVNVRRPYLLAIVQYGTFLPLMSSSPHPITMTQCCWRKGTSSEFASLGCSQIVRYAMHYLSKFSAVRIVLPSLHIIEGKPDCIGGCGFAPCASACVALCYLLKHASPELFAFPEGLFTHLANLLLRGLDIDALLHVAIRIVNTKLQSRNG